MSDCGNPHFFRRHHRHWGRLLTIQSCIGLRNLSRQRHLIAYDPRERVVGQFGGLIVVLTLRVRNSSRGADPLSGCPAYDETDPSPGNDARDARRFRIVI